MWILRAPEYRALGGWSSNGCESSDVGTRNQGSSGRASALNLWTPSSPAKQVSFLWTQIKSTFSHSLTPRVSPPVLVRVVFFLACLSSEVCGLSLVNTYEVSIVTTEEGGGSVCSMPYCLGARRLVWLGLRFIFCFVNALLPCVWEYAAF